MRAAFLIVRKLVPHVEERFLMHRLMLQDREDRFGMIESGSPGRSRSSCAQRLEYLLVCFLRQTPGRPTGSATQPPHQASTPSSAGSDAAREQLLEPCIDARTAKRALDQRVETERR
jgi:hypothetical protein